MNLATLSEIENQIAKLSPAEQLWLAERLIRHVRENTATMDLDKDDPLAMMAADPEIQRELQLIADEFAITEAVGLADL